MLFSVVYDSPARRSAAAPANLASFVFLDPAADEFYADPDDAAAVCVRILRAQAGATPHDRHLTRLIGELSTRSEDFRRRWAAHDVGVHRTGGKTLRHREVGELVLGFEQLHAGLGSLDRPVDLCRRACLTDRRAPSAAGGVDGHRDDGAALISRSRPNPA
nr:hypothetical protein [Actinomadura violacea]